MTSRRAASRYARALFDVSLREADPREVEAELTAFVDLARGHELLWKILLNPAVPVTSKRVVMTAIVGRAGLTPVLGKLLILLTDRDRLAVLPDLVRMYHARVMEHLQVVQAEVTIAEQLHVDRLRALEDRFAVVLGKRVSVLARVDPAIIGGVVTRIGSTVYDGSIARHLERMKNKLKETTLP